MNECMLNDTTNVNCRLGCTGCAGHITKEDLKNYLNNKNFFRERLAEYKEDLRIAEYNADVGDMQYFSRVLNLIEKQSKEIEELKEDRKNMQKNIYIIILGFINN